MAEKDIKVAALDFGSNAIKLAVAEKTIVQDGEDVTTLENHFRVIYLDSEPSDGAVMRGMVFNLNETALKVGKLLKRAEKEIGAEIYTLHIGVAGQGLHSFMIKQSQEYPNPHEITNADIKSLASSTIEQDNLNYLDINFAKFYVNGSFVQNPVGVKASKLEGNYQAIVIDRQRTDDIENVLEDKLSLDTKHHEMIPAVTFSQLVLTPEQRRIGSAVIDFGAETTTVCYFNHGVLESLRVIPMGGAQITHDLMSLKISPEEAERIKTTEGSLDLDPKDNEKIYVKSADMQTENMISRYSVNQLIKARVHEIVENIKAVISRINEDGKLPGGIVVTGGASRLTGLIPFVQETFDNVGVKVANQAFFNDTTNQEMIAEPQFHMLYSMLYTAVADISEGKAEVEAKEELHTEELSEEMELESATAGSLFSEEVLEEVTVSEPKVAKKERKPREERKKKEKQSGKIWSKIMRLLPLDDEDLLSDDED